MIANIQVLDKFSDLDNHTGSFVASDEGQLNFEWPVTLPCVEIGMAHCSSIISPITL